MGSISGFLGEDSSNPATPTAMCKSAQTCPQFFVQWSKLEPKGGGNAPRRGAQIDSLESFGAMLVPRWCHGGVGFASYYWALPPTTRFCFRLLGFASDC